MVKENPVVIIYESRAHRGFDIKIVLYENGEADIDSALRKKKILLSPEKVKSFAERLVGAGFFEFKDRYSPKSPVFDASTVYITLNYGGRAKIVEYYFRQPDSKEFRKVERELLKLTV